MGSGLLYISSTSSFGADLGPAVIKECLSFVVVLASVKLLLSLEFEDVGSFKVLSALSGTAVDGFLIPIVDFLPISFSFDYFILEFLSPEKKCLSEPLGVLSALLD